MPRTIEAYEDGVTRLVAHAGVTEIDALTRVIEVAPENVPHPKKPDGHLEWSET